MQKQVVGERASEDLEGRLGQRRGPGCEICHSLWYFSARPRADSVLRRLPISVASQLLLAYTKVDQGAEQDWLVWKEEFCLTRIRPGGLRAFLDWFLIHAAPHLGPQLEAIYVATAVAGRRCLA
jgi:hypothetical protein